MSVTGSGLRVFPKLVLTAVFATTLAQCGGEDALGPESLSERQLAFIGTLGTLTDVYLVNADGSDLVNLTNASEPYTDLSWSPDGSRLAVATEERLIYIVNADGSGRTLVTGGTLTGRAPVWSPDGTRLAFEEGFWPDGDVFMAYAATGAVSNVSRTSRDEYAPAWSPDGSLIAFVRALINSNEEIFVTHPDTGDAVQLTDHPAGDFRPVWSADGLRIAFMSFRDGGGSLYAMGAGGESQTRLTSFEAKYTLVSWSPDAMRLVALSEVLDDYEVRIVNADASGDANLSNSSAREDCPVWSPDGGSIAYLSYRNDGYGVIYVADPQGGAAADLTGPTAVDQCPVWSADGEWLATTSFLAPDAPSGLTVMRRDGSDREVIVDLFVEEPRWRP